MLHGGVMCVRQVVSLRHVAVTRDHWLHLSGADNLHGLGGDTCSSLSTVEASISVTRASRPDFCRCLRSRGGGRSFGFSLLGLSYRPKTSRTCSGKR